MDKEERKNKIIEIHDWFSFRYNSHINFNILSDNDINAAYNILIVQDHDYYNSHNSGWDLYLKHILTEEKKYLYQGIELNNDWCFITLGVLEKDQNKKLEYYLKSVEIGNNVYGHFRLCEIYNKLNDKDKAIYHLEKYVELFYDSIIGKPSIDSDMFLKLYKESQYKSYIKYSKLFQILDDFIHIRGIINIILEYY
jgi:hypothetical protein